MNLQYNHRTKINVSQKSISKNKKNEIIISQEAGKQLKKKIKKYNFIYFLKYLFIYKNN